MIHRPRLIVTPRRPPPIMGIHVGIRGEVGVQKIRRDGVVTHRHRQSNVILDGGMDYGLEQAFGFGDLHNNVAVGDGSTAPATNQTSLDNELERVATTLGLGTNGEVIEVTTGEFRYRRVRAFDFDQANGNLTEFGGSYDNTDLGALATRELFRDEFGDPITITKTNNEILLVTYDLFATVTPTVETSDGNVTYTNLGTFAVTKVALKEFGYNDNTDSGVGFIWSTGSSITPEVVDNTMNYTTQAGTGLQVSAEGNEGYVWEPYVAGSLQRDVFHSWGPHSQDYTVYGIVLIDQWASTGRRPSYRFKFGSSFVKDKDYRWTYGARISASRT